MNKLNTIRNFCIIAHIDHGKSTLCDRLLELTGTIKKGEQVAQVLDSNPISRERGITIKLAPVTVYYSHKSQSYQLNIIDTPGHVDFNYEVSRSLAACEGAILIVDASQGIQAQTLSYWRKAKKQGLVIIPVINKIDLATAQTNKVKKNMAARFSVDPKNILELSAKTGKGVKGLLEKIIRDLPSPESKGNKLQALVFDSFYHPFKGVVTYLRLTQGEINQKNMVKLMFIASKTNIKALEIGQFRPQLTQVSSLKAGEVGYLATGLKDIRKAQVGDTLTEIEESAPPLPGYKKPQAVVFFNFFPSDLDQFELLQEGLLKLSLNDASLNFRPVFSQALGKGYRCGFLGLLHAEIVQERLEREYNVSLIATQPSVLYQINKGNYKELVSSASALPAGRQKVFEPMIRATIFTPETYLGNIYKLCEDKRGQFINLEHYGLQLKLLYKMPLAEVIVDFFSRLKEASSGFASFDYELIEYQELEAVRLDILVHGQIVEALSQIVTTQKAYGTGREMVTRLKSLIPRQQFEFAIQAAIGSKVIASEKIKAFRKDVTAKLYGGDQTRKDKLLKKQKKGKKRLKQFGKISIPQEAFLAALKRD